MNQLCRHIFPAGRHCTQPAVRTTLYCRHHQVIKRALAQVEPKPDPYGIYKPLPFVFPEDRAALQINFMLVAQALNDRSIHIQMANAFNRIFRSCEINLSRGPLTEPNTKARTKKSAQDHDRDWDQNQDYDPASDPNIIHRVILTPQGEEISVPRTRFEENEAPLTHGKDCPCRVCAEEHRGAPLEEHHVDCKCGFCEEIIEPQPTASEQQVPSPSLTPAPAAATDGSHVEDQNETDQQDQKQKAPPLLGDGALRLNLQACATESWSGTCPPPAPHPEGRKPTTARPELHEPAAVQAHSQYRSSAAAER